MFNPGERVEGYTNFLWVLLLTPLYGLTKSIEIDFTRAAIALNALIGMADLVLVFLIGRRLTRGDWIATSVAVVLCALDNSYQVYAMSGLENHLLILCLLGAVAFWTSAWRIRWLPTGICLALAAMTRPDAVLFAACFGLSQLWATIRAPRGERLAALRIAALALGVFTVAFGAYFAWRYHYYGRLFPNTST